MGTDPLPVEVVVARRVSKPVWWAPVSRQLERITSALPVHRDSASGRRNANQMRLVMLATGILVVVLWQSPWAPTALILCLSALVLPLSESRRRQLVASLRTGRNHTQIVRTPGVLEIDETHVTLTCEDDVVRRMRRKALKSSRVETALELRVGSKKRERLLAIDTQTEPSDDLWIEVDDVRSLEGALR